MRVFRYLLSLLSLLASLSLGGLTYFAFFSYRPQSEMIISIADNEFHPGFVVASLTALALYFTFLAFPPWRRRKSFATRKPTTDVDTQKIAKVQALASKTIKPLEKSAPVTDSTPKDYYENPPLPEASPELLAEFEDEITDETLRIKMNQLISMTQGGFNKNNVTSLLNDHYPDLLWIIDQIKDNSSVRALGTMVASIGRNKIKISDKSLSDNQFSIFQKKIFEDESMPVLRLYLPQDRTNLTTIQKEHFGRAADTRSWEHLQREVKGSESDWVIFTLGSGTKIKAQLNS